MADVMVEMGITGVEVAPTKTWPQPLEANDAEIVDYRRFWEDRGIRIVAMQALLYGREDLAIFEGDEKRRETQDYLRGVMAVAAKLGAGPLVFGSPKNRRRGELSPGEAQAIAAAFFRKAGEAAQELGVRLCIKPNPPQYACDFVNRSDEGLELVRAADSAGFGLHLDAAGMTLSEEPLVEALERCAGSICHFHVSEPFLGPIGEGGVDHETLAATLKRIGYDQWVSVEMRHDPERETLAEIRRVIGFLLETYGDR